MRKEPDNQPSSQAMAKIAHKNAAAAATFQQGDEDSYDSDSDPAYHFSYFVQDQLEALLADVSAATAVGYCDPLWSPGTIPCFQDILVPQ